MLDLPLHPLVVHAVVVLLPLSALALLLVLAVRRWRPAYAWLAVGGVVAGTIASIGSVLSGRVLAETMGTPDRHANLGMILAYVAGALSVAAVAWWFTQRRGRGGERDSSGVKVLGWVSAVLAVSAVVLTVLTGHSGAEAAWGGVGQTADIAEQDAAGTAEPADENGTTATGDADQESDEANSQDEESSSTTEEQDEVPTFTMEEVAQRATSDECWAAVSGNVYDLTEWIAQHPGGPQRIERLCGTDATTQFAAEHSSSAEALQQLAALQIGTLVQ